MIQFKNQKLVALCNTLHLKIADAGAAQLDTSWKMTNVCSPYSRLYFISKGGGILTLQGREITLQEGSAYLIPAGLLYDYRCEDSMEQLYFHVNLIQVNGMDLFYGCGRIFERKIFPEYVESVSALYQSDLTENVFTLLGMLWDELGRFIKMAGLKEVQTRVYSEMVEQVFCLAQNPVSAANHVRSLADRLHVSESTLSKRFRTETGMSPGAYLEQLVIQKACRLLIEEDESMMQIAEKLGFVDQFSFAKYFKRRMQMPPSAYRRQMRGE